jgi:hemoglobin-like flavoprotein
MAKDIRVTNLKHLKAGKSNNTPNNIRNSRAHCTLASNSHSNEDHLKKFLIKQGLKKVNCSFETNHSLIPEKQAYASVNPDESHPFLILFSSSQSVAVLKRFMEHEYSSENIDFVMAVFLYREIKSKKKRTLKALQIHKEFIVSTGPRQINISDICAKNISAGLEEAAPELFDQAKDHLLSVIRTNSFPRFSKAVKLLVTESWKRATEKFSVTEIGSEFYTNLFKLSPSTERLFTKANSKSQSAMFASMIDHCVTCLSDLKTFITQVSALSKRHRTYRCHKGHLPAVKKSFIKTMRKVHENNWSEEVEEAWSYVYELIAVIMNYWLPSPPLLSEKVDSIKFCCTS